MALEFGLNQTELTAEMPINSSKSTLIDLFWTAIRTILKVI
jgi:hypothetical protein